MRDLGVAAESIFFRDLAYVFMAAVAGGALARLAGQPLVLGYVLGGILISPLTPGPAVSDLHTFELFAEIGVILLMFSVGIEFSLRDLLRVKWVALLGGPLGIALSVAMGLGVASLLGWTPLQGAIVGIVLSVASTMVLARLLMDRGELHSRHGRVMIGITLVEDLAVVVLIVVIPTLGTLEPGRLLTIAGTLGKALLVLIPAGYVAAKLIPPLMTRVARMHSDEMFLLVALAVGLGTAALTQAAGLSLALGAFLAGLIINGSEYAHETLARLLPLRDVFVALFFVTIGALIDPGSLVANVPLLATMVAMVVVGKLVLWTLVVWLFRQSLWTALLVGVGLTQIGEFSFILVQVARTAGHVGPEIYNATLAASLITILINAALVRAAPGWIARLRGVEQSRAPGGVERAEAEHVVLCGFGRVGSAVGEALETFGVRFVVIERDPDIVRGLRSRAVPCLFGDAAQARLLEEAGAGRASLVVVALPEMDRAQLAVRARPGAQPARAGPGAGPQRLGPRRPRRGGRHRGHRARAGGGGHPDPPRAAPARAAAGARARLPHPVPRGDEPGPGRRPRRAGPRGGAARGARGEARRRRARRSVARRGAGARALRGDGGLGGAAGRHGGGQSVGGDAAAPGRPAPRLRPARAGRRVPRGGGSPPLSRAVSAGSRSRSRARTRAR